MNEMIGFALEIGTTVAAATIGGLLLGRFLDGHFGWAPWGLVGGMIAGIVVATVALAIRASRLMK